MPRINALNTIPLPTGANRATTWIPFDDTPVNNAVGKTNLDSLAAAVLASPTVNASVNELQTNGGALNLGVAGWPAIQTPSTGLYFQPQGVVRAGVNSGGITVGDTGSFSWGSPTGGNTHLYRDAADQIGIRNGTNPQSLAIYGTYTDASNYERFRTYYDSITSAYTFKSEALGTGTLRKIEWYLGTTPMMRIETSLASFFCNVNVQRCRGVPSSASEPAFSFTTATNAGMYLSGTTELRFSTGGSDRVQMSSEGLQVLSGAIATGEISAPSGVANQAVIFAEDNGSGKTRLMVQFGTGAAQQIAIEP